MSRSAGCRSGRPGGRPSSGSKRTRVPRPGRSSAVVLGALASGFGNYLFQVVATRSLGDEAFAPLGVLWTIWYLLLTIFLYAVESWVTRARAGGETDGGLRPLAWAIGLVAAGVGGVTWLFAGPLFAGLDELAGVSALLVLTYGAFAVLRGELAGANRFRPYAVLTAVESLAKVALAVPVALLAPSTTALSLLLPAGPVIAIACWWVWRRRAQPAVPAVAEPAGEPLDAGPGPSPAADLTADPMGGHPQPGRFILVTAVPGAAAQVLLAAGPLVLVAMAATASQVSVFFVTITAARVPIVLAFGGLLSLILRPLTRMARAGEVRRLRRIGTAIAGGALLLSVVGAVVGKQIGPPLVMLMFGAAFEPPGWLAALAAYGVTIASGGMGLNQLLIAQGREVALIPPWCVAVLAAGAAIAMTGGDPSWRVAVGFAVGVTVALLGLLASVVRSTASPATTTEAGGRSLEAGGAGRS